MERVGSVINRVLDDVAAAMERKRRAKDRDRADQASRVSSEAVAAVEEAVTHETRAERVQREIDALQRKDAAE